MNTRHLSFILICLLPLFLSAQPKMSIWQVDHKSTEVVSPHSSSHNAVLWDCGFEYYSIYPGDNVSHEVILHILNEGSDTLIIDEPSLFNTDDGYTVTDSNADFPLKIAPNYEYQLVLNFISGTYSNQSAEFVLNSNDPSNSNCYFSLEVGVNPGNGSFSDPCSCDNIVLIGGGLGYLFRDTLKLNSAGNVKWNLDINNNLLGFVDIAGNPIKPIGGTPYLDLGETSTILGPINYVFYRHPSEIPNLTFQNQGSFVSMITCGDTCLTTPIPAVPTLSQWAMISLGILLMIFGIVGLRSRSLLKTESSS